MIELLILGLIVAAIVGTVTIVGPGETIGALGRIAFLAAIVLFMISAVVGVARGRLKA
jgi:L-cystine uptake protein TcyP (sodium:dicarboxylate symporter family)